ncbi:MAG: hypothetical protein SGBAC_003708 [Bacillariaceae sp.]
MSNTIKSLPLLSLDEEKPCDDSAASTGRRTSLKRTKSKKKKRKSKRPSSDSATPITKGTSTKSKTKRKSKTKMIDTPETKNVAAMMKKLEIYEESLQEECQILQKERDDIAAERQTLQLRLCELESKLDELEDDKHNKKPMSSSILNYDALKIENAILQRRLQRQDEIILQLSNSRDHIRAVEENNDASDKIARLEKELAQAKELASKNEKIIKGQKMTIDRMKKETSSAKSSETMGFPIQVLEKLERQKNKDDSTVATAPFGDSFSSSLSSFGDSLSSLDGSCYSSSLKTGDKKKKTRKMERGSSTSSLGRIANRVKISRRDSSRASGRNRHISPEERKLSSLLESM